MQLQQQTIWTCIRIPFSHIIKYCRDQNIIIALHKSVTHEILLSSYFYWFTLFGHIPFMTTVLILTHKHSPLLKLVLTVNTWRRRATYMYLFTKSRSDTLVLARFIESLICIKNFFSLHFVCEPVCHGNSMWSRLFYYYYKPDKNGRLKNDGDTCAGFLSKTKTWEWQMNGKMDDWHYFKRQQYRWRL